MTSTVLTAAEQNLLAFLTEQARRTPGKTVTYGEVARTLDPDYNPRDRHHAKLIGHLYSVNHFCFEQGMPLFGCLVVRASDRKPGDGFYILARDLGFRIDHDQAAEAEFWDDQVTRAAEYAARTQEHEQPTEGEPSITVHVLQVNDKPENTTELANAIMAGRTESWQMPMGARPGDLAVWYAAGRRAMVYMAWGWVDGIPKKITDGTFGPYRGPVAGLRNLDDVSRQDVIDYCGFNGGHQGPRTLRGARALDFLEAVGLGVIAETVRQLARTARRSPA
jgi:hypothetical protein